MNENGITVSELERDLANIAEGGIQADRKRLKEDMCAQFADYREWIREYVVNAFDARARSCWISGYEDEKTITIVVEDDGHGMDRKGVLDFNTLYRSVKPDDSGKTIGCHGIGKLSVAAIPGQCRFIMMTSTGKECWRMVAGRLLDEEPIKLERVEPIPQQGTRFEITFRKKNSLREELKKLGDILERYVRYLPLAIVVFERIGDEPDAPERPRWIRGTWEIMTERFGRMFSFELDRKAYEVIIGIESEKHEIYQNRVLISNRYNLLSHDLHNELKVPHLKIRVDSPDFELPFGRHCLCNEEVLNQLSKHLRKNILPQYVNELCIQYKSFLLGEYNVFSEEVENIVCSLIAYDPSPQHSWCQLPAFIARNWHRLSMVELKQIVDEKGILYLESEDSTGIDYALFDAPVLSRHQAQGGLKLLVDLFKKVLVNLNLGDVILETPSGAGLNIGPREQHFQKFLGFHPEALRRIRQKREEHCGGSIIRLSNEEMERYKGVCEESRDALEELTLIKWRVNYLVKRDAKSPCYTHRFLLKNDTVVLNLNHPEVKQLLELSGRAPALAGHWALAMCLSDTDRLLPHLTPEAREDLILLDAMAKCGLKEISTEINEGNEDVKEDRRWLEFLRNIKEINPGMN